MRATPRFTSFDVFFFLVAALAMLVVPSYLCAQGETTAAILGQVTDSSNEALPGATVTVTNHDTGLKRTAQTDGEGRFKFPQLLPGTYVVQATAEGFEPQKIENVFAGLGQKQSVESDVARRRVQADCGSECRGIDLESE